MVIAALAVGGYELASGHQTPAGTTTTPPTAAATSSGSGSTSASGSGANKGSTSARHHAGSAKPSTGPKSTASGLQPTSQSPSLVTYQAPGSSYSVKFTVTGTSSCWVGVQQRQNGPWLWMGTLTPGSTYTYQASGSVVVRIGAPSEVQVAVSGQKLALPASYVQAYDIALTAGAQASAA
ncbi:MAG: hypothetical protein JWM85_2019 [Acidimicrobiaceae bacterium]|nr:hypothetical protein [Acidimicrobiaceae bacterium]